ncbi:MAG: TonB-dependent receptor, partial [Pelobium sp.]
MIKKLFFLLFLFPFVLNAQTTQKIKGLVKNEEGEPLTNVIVKVQDFKLGTSTNEKGIYELNLKPGNYIISFSALGYITANVEVKVAVGEDVDLSIILRHDLKALEEVIVEDQLNRNQGLTNLNPKFATAHPNVSQSFESILKQLPGVATNNELSAQYSVRGGSFDENLIYINDIEIYKPYLVRNGQQEGLSLINPDLVGGAKFSAGGFTPKYGDKLSSVLDVQYKTKDSVNFTVGFGTNGESITVMHEIKNLTYAFGYRHKQNTPVLNSQPVVGSYNPKFYDFQGIINWKINPKTSIQYLGIYNSSKFGLIPESRETQFGSFKELLRLSVDYEGQENDEYNNALSSITLNRVLSKKANLKWINSVFFITEKENFDILGQYVFEDIENDFGKNNFGKVKANRGLGAFQNYGRNELKADIYATDLKLNFTGKKSFWETGLRLQYNQIADELKEFQLIDSAGFTIPFNFNDFQLTQSVEASNSVNTYTYSGFVQNTANISKKLTYTGGIRFNYNSFTKEFLPSPRIVFAYHPAGEKDVVYRFAGGFYVQPPFYRELRNFDGSLNSNAKSQKSLHFVLSSDYRFKGLGTLLNFTAEAYYKYLYHLIPYDIENVRVRYYANQQAKGYAAGIDFRINGEFVKDLESSFRLSIMKTSENIQGDAYQKENSNGTIETFYPGFLKRPTDQRVNFSAFFQDKLFSSPTYKVHINLMFGSRLPTGPPASPRYQQVFHIPAYKRMDIGFSKDILDPESTRKPKLIKKYFKSMIIYAEVFNLLNINNTVSFLWITDVNNYQYA